MLADFAGGFFLREIFEEQRIAHDFNPSYKTTSSSPWYSATISTGPRGTSF